MKQITAKCEIGTGYKKRDVFRIIQSDNPKFWVGSCLNLGSMRIAIKEGYKIILLPQ
jgi:hypothetical protein